ncbi:hypothetical protein BDW74DRAFT_157486 [Aspergillus multicolor]|uniref:uncharacterized protein n=1 Tax=Aspergillus multicolor TaxID=41759 RepID=UPI003CCCD2F1
MAEEFEELGRLGDTGHVNLVLADWEPEDGLEDGGEGWYEEEVLELIDGCTQEDVGWMKVSGSGLLPCFFIYLGDPEDWHYKYVRPPEMYYIGYM